MQKAFESAILRGTRDAVDAQLGAIEAEGELGSVDMHQWSYFQILIQRYFLGTWILYTYLFIIKINNFPGDLSDISA